MAEVIRLGLAAGLLKEPGHFTDDLLRSAASFLTLGALTKNAREGNPEPRTSPLPGDRSYVNAVNLANPGSPAARDFMLSLAMRVRGAGKELVVNLTPTRSGEVRAMLEDVGVVPYRNYVIEYSVNAACPNHREGAGRLHDILAYDPSAVDGLLEETRGFCGPFSLKIAPDTPYDILVEICEVCDRHGVKRIVSGNTRRIETPVIDGKPVLHPTITHCGLSGEPLLEGNLQQVRNLRKIIEERQFPIRIRACGGVLDGEALGRYVEAGADEAELATGYAIHGARIFSDVFSGYYA